MPPGDIFYDRKLWDEVTRWQINLFKRQVRRFYTGNILSGIVQAQEDREKYQSGTIDGSQEVTNFHLIRFTNIDGSITTAVELTLPLDLTQNSLITASSEALAIDCDSPYLVQYATEMPLSRNEDSIIPVWNIGIDKVYDKVTDRGIAIIKKRIAGREMIEFEIIQSFTSSKEKGTNRNLFKERKEGEVLYNYLYHNDAFLNRFRDNLVIQNTNKQEITYGLKSWREPDPKKGGTVVKTKYNKLYVFKKILVFEIGNENAMRTMNQFLIELKNLYQVSFSFRSSGTDYLNIEDTEDVETELVQTEAVASKYPVGDYEYIFLRNIPDSVLTLIPNVKSKTRIGIHGGLILTQPIEPNRLPSFELRPYKIPNSILIQLAMSVLESTQREDFIRELNSIAYSSSDVQVGDFVRRYLTSRSVPIEYFFGDLRGSQYGKLFKENAMNLDVTNITFVEEPEDALAPTVKREINLQDAEDYLLNLLKLL